MRYVLLATLVVGVVFTDARAEACETGPREPWFDPAWCYCPTNGVREFPIGRIEETDNGPQLVVEEVIGRPPPGIAPREVGDRISLPYAQPTARALAYAPQALVYFDEHGREILVPEWQFIALPTDDDAQMVAPFQWGMSCSDSTARVGDMLVFLDELADQSECTATQARHALDLPAAPPKPAQPSCGGMYGCAGALAPPDLAPLALIALAFAVRARTRARAR